MKKNSKIFIVVSQFYPELSNLLLDGCIEEFVDQGIQTKNISIYRTSGVFELPGLIAQLSKYKTIDAVVALGVVIK